MIPDGIIPVKPINGEKLDPPHPSWSIGMTHMMDANGNPAGVCGIYWFEDNAVEVDPTTVPAKI